jgi:hypothetical protein
MKTVYKIQLGREISKGYKAASNIYDNYILAEKIFL